MRSRVFAGAVAIIIAAAPQVSATEEQLRVVVHPTVRISGPWYGAGWVIANARNGSPDNLNLFGGVGYRYRGWSSELLIQRHYNPAGDQWMLNSRTMGSYRGLSLYHEVAPNLTRRGWYQQVIAERKVHRRLVVGAETENVYRPGRDSLGAGPRVSTPVKAGSVPGALVLSYQFRRTERDALRLWVVFHPKF